MTLITDFSGGPAYIRWFTVDESQNGVWSVQTDRSSTGSYALNGDAEGGFDRPLSGVTRVFIVDRGSVPISADVYVDEFTTSAKFLWAVQSETTWDNMSCYAFSLDPVNRQYEIERYDNGSKTQLVQVEDTTISAQTWHNFSVDTWKSDGTMTVSAGPEQSTVVDTTYSSGGIGTYANAIYAGLDNINASSFQDNSPSGASGLSASVQK